MDETRRFNLLGQNMYSSIFHKENYFSVKIGAFC